MTTTSAAYQAPPRKEKAKPDTEKQASTSPGGPEFFPPSPEDRSRGGRPCPPSSQDGVAQDRTRDQPCSDGSLTNLPRHVAIIMDGNGRWAEQRGLPRLDGHKRGARSVREVVRFSRELGIEALTLYAFSAQNWGRPSHEVLGLMQLLADYLIEEREEILQKEIRLTAIGSLSRLPDFVKTLLDDLIRDSAHHQKMTLCLALSYGGKESLVEAARALCRRAAAGELAPDDVSEAHIGAALETRDLPPLDLVIRTSGEERLSNFLLWEAAYAELYFTKTLWPEFSRADFLAALEHFCARERRFGLAGS